MRPSHFVWQRARSPPPPARGSLPNICEHVRASRVTQQSTARIRTWRNRCASREEVSARLRAFFSSFRAPALPRGAEYAKTRVRSGLSGPRSSHCVGGPCVASAARRPWLRVSVRLVRHVTDGGQSVIMTGDDSSSKGVGTTRVRTRREWIASARLD